MQLLFDFLPIILFFIAFKIQGIYLATGIAMAVSLLQVSVGWIKYRKIHGIQLINLGIILVLGSATLFLHNAIFIKWKPTIIYWALALVFMLSQLLTHRSLIQRIMDNKFSLPSKIWQRLNVSWIFFFIAMGSINLYVVYHFTTNTWVNFKLFGILGLTVFFVVLQSFYMAKYIKSDESTEAMSEN